MKNIFYSVLIIVFITAIKLNAQPLPPLYLNFVLHNEENMNYLMQNSYLTNRSRAVQLINLIESKSAKLNFQSDWTFLKGVDSFDVGGVTASTNNKNLIRWLVEDKGMEADAHAHETQYNYADVSYLHSVLGITPTKNVGGFLFDTIISGNNWENLENGMYGIHYPSYFWKPDNLWGAATQNHVNDPYHYGIYKPQDMANFYVHDSTNWLALIGGGCPNKIRDTSSVNYVFGIVKNILDAIDNHTVPDSGFYTASIFISMGDVDAITLQIISDVADSIAPYVAQGRVIYSTLTQTGNTWRTSYAAQPFRIDCSQLTTGINDDAEDDSDELLNVFPNPAQNFIRIKNNQEKALSITIFSSIGEVVQKIMLAKEAATTINLSGLTAGIYLITAHSDKNFTARKIIKE